ncbi:hypothetical protein [Pseudotamlana agarivorans]|uniref:hypothetical protein n=1 Tax=Pseudotamlana agarivorans TaxID=481183 RepID=UPI000835C9BB|nr:hypothetical protein [Tamlana agarivorans]
MKKYYALIVLFLVFQSLFSQSQQIYILDFETDPSSTSPSIYTTNPHEQIIAGKDEKDYFVRTNGTTISGDISYTNQTGHFFGAQDFRFFSGYSDSFIATLTVNNIDISGFENLKFKVDLAEHDNGPSWEDDDFVLFKYSIDSQTNQQLLYLRWDKSGSSEGYLAVDTDNDGVGEGQKVNDAFSPFNADITGTGSLLTITIEIHVDSSEEDIAIDNIEIWGDPIAGYCSGGTTTWDGSNWVGGTPDTDTAVIVDADYFTGTTGSFEACNLTVTSGNLLSIDTNGTIVVENDVIVENNASLIVQSGSALVQHNDNGLVTNNGTMSFHRETAPMDAWYEYTYWSSPIVGAQVSTAIPFYNPNRLFIFNAQNYRDSTKEDQNNNATIPGQDEIDDDGNDWTHIGDTTMQPGIGYSTTTTPAYFNANNAGPGTKFVAIFTGVFNNGVYNVDVYGNDDEKSDQNWNLIGNPYPSAIDSDVFFSVNPNLERAVYLWSQNSAPSSSANGNQQQNFNTADYAIINDTGVVSSGGDTSTTPVLASLSTYAIPSGQSFFVALKDGGGTGINQEQITFNNSMRSEFPAANRVFFKESTSSKTVQTKDNKIWLNLHSTDNTSNQILVGYVPGATDMDDGLSYDAHTYPVNGSLLYSTIPGSDKKFIIQGKYPGSLTVSEVIPLGFKSTLDATISYTISIHNTEGDFFNNHEVLLIDKAQTPEIQWNLNQNDYIFSAPQTGEFNDRFEIRFEKTLSVEDIELEDKVRLISLENNVVQFIVPKDLKIETISIFNLLGQPLYQLEGDSYSETYELPNLSAVFIAEIKLSNGQVLTKKGVSRY